MEDRAFRIRGAGTTLSNVLSLQHGCFRYEPYLFLEEP
jgi:hypothetical protein